MSNADDYTVGWVCAVEVELVAAQELLDEEYDPIEAPSNDNNNYTFGRIGSHYVIIAALPLGEYGLVSAASVARDMVRSFPNIRIGLMVGIGGGAPGPRHDIRLGDVVVSSPGPATGGVLQYDYGKTVQGGNFIMTGYLNKPPQLFLTALSQLKAQYRRKGHEIDKTIQSVCERNSRLRPEYCRPDSTADRLYLQSYIHKAGDDCAIACGVNSLIDREPRLATDDNPAIHYGLIASANQLMKDASLRDRLSEEKNILCFEMEAAGLMNHFPCLVVRGICDYSDTHKNKLWQGYAAMTAAAYAKDLLNKITPNKVKTERKLSEILNKVQVETKQIKTRVENLGAQLHLEEVKNWLSPPDPSTDFNNARDRCLEGSGQWLLQDLAYSTWRSKSNSVLWLHGTLGCGKTVLASTIIENLRKTCFQGLFYFFFTFSDTSKQDFADALRSLVIQLYFKKHDVRDHLDSLFDSCQNGKSQPSLKMLLETFHCMARQAGEIWIVLDALDECPTLIKDPTGNKHPRKKLLSWLEDLWSSDINIHLLVTSRPEQDIKETFEHCSQWKSFISLQTDLVRNDIRTYIQTRVRDQREWKRSYLCPELQDKIERELIKKADGMFRWVSCQLDTLESCDNRYSIEKTLNSLPETLDDMYARELANIPKVHRDSTMRLLQFLTYSKRPLRLEEAVDVIAVQPANTPRFDPKDRLVGQRQMQKYCGSLVLVTATKDEAQNDQIVMEMRLAHHSVREYLVSKRAESESAGYLEEMVSRASIAAICLSYLLEVEDDDSPERINQNFPLTQYAAECWASHAVITESRSRDVRALTMELLRDRTRYDLLRRLSDRSNCWSWEGVIPPSALCFASRVGLKCSVRKLINHEVDTIDHYGYALRAASDGGYLEIAQMLLESGADVNAMNENFDEEECEEFTWSDYGSALYNASYRGHEEIVRLLLDRGADVNAIGGKHGYALQAASHNGYRNIVQFLLEQGADINAAGGCCSNALSAAWFGDSEEMMKILLDKGADPTMQGGAFLGRGGFWEYALPAASRRGWGDVIQMLLDRGADLNVPDPENGNPFEAALERGDVKTFHILLDGGKRVKAARGFYGTALRAAAANGVTELVQMLLDQGIDPNTRMEGYDGVFNRDYDEYNAREGDALCAACEKGYAEIVLMLLEKGANPNVKGSRVALEAASMGGHKDIVQMLLEKGANPNVERPYCDTALVAAAKRGHKDIVRMLLEKGANQESCITALKAATERKHKDIVQMLLEKGTNTPNGQDHFQCGISLQAETTGDDEESGRMLDNQSASSSDNDSINDNSQDEAKVGFNSEGDNGPEEDKMQVKSRVRKSKRTQRSKRRTKWVTNATRVKRKPNSYEERAGPPHNYNK
ncbi:ankyrin repeat-containing domain protein [Xylaria cf. heliscus]|nr:ankyrin repeat-containing domain protein [Xylaria cf. heliscus]